MTIYTKSGCDLIIDTPYSYNESRRASERRASVDDRAPVKAGRARQRRASGVGSRAHFGTRGEPKVVTFVGSAAAASQPRLPREVGRSVQPSSPTGRARVAPSPSTFRSHLARRRRAGWARPRRAARRPPSAASRRARAAAAASTGAAKSTIKPTATSAAADPPRPPLRRPRPPQAPGGAAAAAEAAAPRASWTGAAARVSAAGATHSGRSPLRSSRPTARGPASHPSSSQRCAPRLLDCLPQLSALDPRHRSLCLKPRTASPLISVSTAAYRTG